MKTKIMKTLLTLGFILPLCALYVKAQPITWDSTSGDWRVGTNWSGGDAPTSVDDVLIEGPFTSATTINHMGGDGFRDLSILFGSGTTSAVNFELGAASTPYGTAERHGRNISLQNSSSGNVFFRMRAGQSLVIEEDIRINTEPGTGSGSQTAGITMYGNASIEFNELWLGNQARLQYVGTAGTTNTIKGDIYIVGNGAGFQAAANQNGNLEVIGNISVDGGTFVVGRLTDTTYTVDVTGDVEVLSGITRVAERSTLLVDKMTVGGGQLTFATASVRGTASLSIRGDFILEGGTFENTASGARSKVEIGGDFYIRNTPTLSLGATNTEVFLAGNLIIESSSLGEDTNLNNLNLLLNGEGLQQLEAALTNGDDTTFRVGKLTLSDSTVQLVDLFDQGAGSDYFWVTELINSGDSTLDLNGVRFYYGDSENKTLLEEGIYTQFGGTLNVTGIPEAEHAAFLLLGVGLVGTLWYRKKTPSAG